MELFKWTNWKTRTQDLATACVIYSVMFILVAGAITAIVVPVLRFGVKPRVEARIEDARLSDFTFANGTAATTTTTSFLAYNISLAISIHNPTGGFVKHTKPLVASIAFHDNRLSTDSVAGEGHKYRPSKKEVHFLLAHGEVPSDGLGAAAVEDFKQQNKTGVFNIEVRLAGEIAFVGLDVLGNKRNLGFSCPLSLQLAPPGPAHGVVLLFHEVNCKTEPQNIYF